MELKELQENLQKQLEEQGARVLESQIWCIPVHSYQIQYQPIQKKSMDILMKILLFSFQKTGFSSADELSEILMVEPLFIQDLMNKLMKNGLLERTDDIYELTEKGKGQFANGVFEEVLDTVTEDVLYSPIHEGFLEGDMEEALDFDDFPDELYRYLEEGEPEIAEDVFLQEIRERQMEDSIEIKKILTNEHLQTNDVPCIEFFLEMSENGKGIKVWNTLLDNWDAQLEKHIQDHQ